MLFPFNKHNPKLVKKTRSEGERLLFKTLATVLDPVEHICVAAKPKWLVNPETGRHLEVDFLLPRSKIAIELQGPHHFDDPVQMKRDRIKYNLLTSKKYKVLYLGLFDITPHVVYQKLVNLQSDCKEQPLLFREKNDSWDKQKQVHTTNYKNVISNRFGKHECHRIREPRVIDWLKYKTTIFVKDKSGDPVHVKILSIHKKTVQVKQLSFPGAVFVVLRDSITKQ